MENLAFKSLLCSLLGKAIGGAIRILVFRIILKISCKISSKYLGVKDGEEDFKAELRAENLSKTKGHSNLLILLLIRDGAQDITFDEVKKATKWVKEAWSLQQQLWSQIEFILWF